MTTYARRVKAETVDGDHAEDPLSSARGILFGCIVSAGLRAGIIAAVIA